MNLGVPQNFGSFWLGSQEGRAPWS